MIVFFCNIYIKENLLASEKLIFFSNSGEMTVDGDFGLLLRTVSDFDPILRNSWSCIEILQEIPAEMCFV